MTIKTAKELKELYLSFFESKDHKRIPSSSLVPENDPTVLFTTAGMHPLVPFLLGEPHSQGKRLCDVQKCVRTGDIDEVGDKVHHTFFEMLGNWSLGDYFKEDAIKISFEFLTQQLNFPIEKLAVTCFEGDDDSEKDTEAYEVWKSLGFPENKITFLPKKDNWWGPAGETGPCGPDTEMFYWTGKDPVPETFDPDNKDWVEIWNDVFMQYTKTKDGRYEPAEQLNVDTGLGVERVTAILQGLDDNYKTELFQPTIKKIEELSNKSYDDPNYTVSMRIIADHMRSAVFIMGDERKISPSNVDQGYIVRRFIRRSIRHCLSLGIPEPAKFTNEVARLIIEQYKDEYEELNKNKSFILDELSKESEKFGRTIETGLKEFNKMGSDNKISAKEAFLLFQSYGFPIEMTEELANEKGIEVDVKGFNEEFKKHQELSRKGAEKKFKGGLADDSEISKKLHTATHLLAEALRRVLSKDIKQRGSNITPERLRFDFNFDRKLTDEEKQEVEDLVNKKIMEALPVERKEMSVEEANKLGAQSEFQDKYGDKVSVYMIGDFSAELCGGPHVNNTSEIGHFKIKKEQSSSGGVRRIKAVIE